MTQVLIEKALWMALDHTEVGLEDKDEGNIKLVPWKVWDHRGVLLED